MALLAAVVLVVAAGSGGAVAGALITGKQIKNESVTGADLKNGTVTGVDLKDGALSGAEVRDGSLGLGDLSAAARGRLGGLLLASVAVRADGSVRTIRTAPGIGVRVDHDVEGIYCIYLIDAAGRTVATPTTTPMTVGIDGRDNPVAPALRLVSQEVIIGCNDAFGVITRKTSFTPEGQPIDLQFNQPFTVQIG
ncbi:hypothetical protein [Nocardioides sp.]|uniref:hypothetical protein n=1 Tax=Nocardioides sp. TaxID=35761 RepID=UPI0035110AD6